MVPRLFTALLTLAACAGSPDPSEPQEDCINGVDDDGDGLTDCADTLACADHPTCGEDCSDGVNNDGDLNTDCFDSECSDLPECAEDCTDGIDNDGDGWVDCLDYDCVAECPEDCADGVDNDNDGLADSLDADCLLECAEDCSDGVDNDLDGQVDCADPDCVFECPESRCTDSVDNDGDGQIDCADSDCTDNQYCPEYCANGLDDDSDGNVDCDDSECQASLWCICTNDVDDDGDGDIDCEDSDCAFAGACTDRPEQCNWHTTLPFKDIDGDGLTAASDPDCLARYIEHDCADGIDNDLDGLADCADEACTHAAECGEHCDNGVDDDADALVDCEDADCAFEPPCVELCDNHVDDDGDGFIDCGDDDCWGAGCIGATSTLVLTATIETEQVLQHHYSSGYHSTVVTTASAIDVAGVVQVLDGYGGVASSCAWSADNVTVPSRTSQVVLSQASVYHRSSSAFVGATRRRGFVLAPGCSITGSEFLPRLGADSNGAMLLIDGQRGRVHRTWGIGPDIRWIAPARGAPWYIGLSPVSETWTQTTTTVWGASSVQTETDREFAGFMPPTLPYYAAP